MLWGIDPLQAIHLPLVLARMSGLALWRGTVWGVFHTEATMI